jgi:hypothetical protein
MNSPPGKIQEWLEREHSKAWVFRQIGDMMQ